MPLVSFRESVLAVSCDNDGNIGHSEYAWYIAIKAVSKSHGGGDITVREWRDHCSGAGHPAILQFLEHRAAENNRPALGIPAAEFTAQCLAAFDFKFVQPRAAVIRAVDAFHQRGILTPCVTGSPTEFAETMWRHLGIYELASGFYGADWDGFVDGRKSYALVAEHLGIPAGRTHALDDSDKGCQIAAEGGVAYVVQPLYHAGLEYTNLPSPHANLPITALDEEGGGLMDQYAQAVLRLA